MQYLHKYFTGSKSGQAYRHFCSNASFFRFKDAIKFLTEKQHARKKIYIASRFDM